MSKSTIRCTRCGKELNSVKLVCECDVDKSFRFNPFKRPAPCDPPVEWWTLADLWEANDRQPIEVISENNTRVKIIGIYGSVAYGVMEPYRDKSLAGTFVSKRVHWKEYKEPKFETVKVKQILPHWPAVIERIPSQYYSLTTRLFHSLKQAQSKRNGVIRLAAQLEPVMLEVTVEETREVK